MPGESRGDSRIGPARGAAVGSRRWDRAQSLKSSKMGDWRGADEEEGKGWGTGAEEAPEEVVPELLAMVEVHLVATKIELLE